MLGRFGQELPLSEVRAVEWVPDARTVLVRRGWWRDPWRLTFGEQAAGEQFFHKLVARFPRVGPALERRVGPNDVSLDPRLIIGSILAVLGLIGLFGGAVEGVGQEPLQGPARRFILFARPGEAIGLAGVLAIGAVVLAAGVFGLGWWYHRRPSKLVVRVTRDAE